MTAFSVRLRAHVKASTDTGWVLIMISKKKFSAVNRYATKAVVEANARYFTSIARAIEEIVHCRIRLKPTDDRHLRGRAETLHRVVEQAFSVPKRKRIRRPEHWIFYDTNLQPAMAGRCIGHELFHIYAHRPTERNRAVHRHIISYETWEEKDADIFSLVLLGTRQFSKNLQVPKDKEEFLDLVFNQAGKPAYLSKEEVEQIADLLFPSPSKQKKRRDPPL